MKTKNFRSKVNEKDANPRHMPVVGPTLLFSKKESNDKGEN